MRFTVLGQVGVLASGRRVALARGRQRTILALLLASDGEVGRLPGMIHTYPGGCSDDSPFPESFPDTALAERRPRPDHVPALPVRGLPRRGTVPTAGDDQSTEGESHDRGEAGHRP